MSLPSSTIGMSIQFVASQEWRLENPICSKKECRAIRILLILYYKNIVINPVFAGYRAIIYIYITSV